MKTKQLQLNTEDGNICNELDAVTSCHFRPSNKNVLACEVTAPFYYTYDARHCDCLRCEKTKAYNIYKWE